MNIRWEKWHLRERMAGTLFTGYIRALNDCRNHSDLWRFKNYIHTHVLDLSFCIYCAARVEGIAFGVCRPGFTFWLPLC